MTSVAVERSKLFAVGLDLRRREEWGSTFDYTDARAVVEPATDQFVHITITNPSSYSSDDAHARAVEAIGKSRFPNTGISYNRLHFQSGRGYEGQPIGRRGAHTVNDDHRITCSTSGCPSVGKSVGDPPEAWNLNYTARAYVICQNVDDDVTLAELDALAQSMAADRLAGLVSLNARIHGHRCVSSKSCPGDKMWQLMSDLKVRIDRYVKQGTVDDMTEAELIALFKEAADESTIRGKQFAGYVRNILIGQDGMYLSKQVLAKDGWLRNVSVTDPASPSYFYTPATVLSDLENTQDKHGQTLSEIKAAITAGGITPEQLQTLADLVVATLMAKTQIEGAFVPKDQAPPAPPTP